MRHLGRYRVTKLVVAITATAALLLAVWSLWPSGELVAGNPRMSGEHLVRSIYVDVGKGWRALFQPGVICQDIQRWYQTNPSALVALLVNREDVILCSFPPGLEKLMAPEGEGFLPWVKTSLGLDGSEYVLKNRKLYDPSATYVGSVVAAVPDVPYLDLLGYVYTNLQFLNPLWIVAYLALLPTWVYLDALYHHRRARALEWAMLCAVFNVVGLAIYLARGRRVPMIPTRRRHAWSE